MRMQKQLIESIYMTAGDPGSWQSLLGDLVTATGSRSARLLVMNTEADRVTSSIKVNIDDSYHQQYADYFVNKCPWRPELRRKSPGRMYSTYLHFSCRQPEFYQTEFFNDWAKKLDIHHGLCGTIYGNSHRTVQLLIQRTRDQGHYTETDTDFVNGLVPHIQHSFLIADQIAGSRARAEAIAIAADSETLPFLLLDGAFKVTYASPGAERIINGESLLVLKNGKPMIADDLQNRRLHRLLRLCFSAAETRMFQTGGGRLAVPRPGRADLQLLVRPVHPDIALLAGQAGVYAAVYLYEPDAGIRIDRDRLRELYELSEAETRMAVAMVDNPDSEALAKRCGISLHTVRSHIKSLFAKTRTHSRAELMKRLLTGPARLR